MPREERGSWPGAAAAGGKEALWERSEHFGSLNDRVKLRRVWGGGRAADLRGWMRWLQWVALVVVFWGEALWTVCKSRHAHPLGRCA